MRDNGLASDSDPFDFVKIGRPLFELLSESIEPKEDIHPWLPAGLTLLAGKSKHGKSTLAEQIAEEISCQKRILYLALEYNKRVAQKRFKKFRREHQIRIVLEGEIRRMGVGGEKDLKGLLADYGPDVVILDLLAKIKRDNTGHYDAEYKAMSEIKELVDEYDVDCLVLTHAGKPTATDSDDPFDKIIGSTAFQGVPDNLMMLIQGSRESTLHIKGRVIFPSEKKLIFKDGLYHEQTGAGADLRDRAPLQSQILDCIDEKGEMRVGELAEVMRRSEAQISTACSTLANLGRIERDNSREPYRLVERYL